MGVDSEGESSTHYRLDIKKDSRQEVVREKQTSLGKGQYWHEAPSIRTPGGQEGDT